MTELVEVRCPEPYQHPDGTCTPGKLFLRLRLSGGQPSYVQPDNLIELACYNCKDRLRQGGRRVARVLHRYDLAGNLVETLVEEQA